MTNQKDTTQLDQEEQEILEAFEGGNLVSVSNLKQEKTGLRQAATNTMTKTQSISIRISKKDLLAIKTKAVEEGIPYQTLIGSAIHKYATKEQSQESVSDSLVS